MIAKIIMRVFTRNEFDGLENMPLSGASMRTINHLGRLDVFLIFSVVKRDDLTGRVAEKCRKIPLITLPALDRATRADALQKGTDEIMCRITALLPEKYHGY